MSATFDTVPPCPSDCYIQPVTCNSHDYEEVHFDDDPGNSKANSQIIKMDVSEQIVGSYSGRMRRNFITKRSKAILVSILIFTQIATWGLLGYFVLRVQGSNGDSTKLQPNLSTVLRLFHQEISAPEVEEIRGTIDELSHEIGSFKVPRTPNVAFYAFRIINEAPGIYKKLVFQNTFINTNNSYNKTTGEFTVPVQGLYWFSSRICRRANTEIDFGIVVNENWTSSNHMYTTDSVDCRALNVINFLNPRDKVSVKTGDATDNGDVILQYYNTNTFMGALIN